MNLENKFISGKRFLVKRDEKKEDDKQGFIMPDSAKKIPNTGIILMVSQDCEIIKDRPVKGLRVYFPHFAGTEIEIEKEKYIILREEDVLLFEKP